MKKGAGVLSLILSVVAATAGDLRTDLERRVELDAARCIAKAEERYQRGLALLRSGRREKAVVEFREAQAAILGADEDAYFETSLRSYLHELRSRLVEPGFSSRGVGGSLGPLPDVSLDARTLAWIASAVKRPIPQEAELRTIFRDRRVPEELIYLGLVESGYRAGAVSPAGAAGPWQLMPETARRYGLRRRKGFDERRDLLKSAQAAADYLSDLYGLLGDWTLPLAAYNADEYRVLRAMQKTGTNIFWRLLEYLPAETAEYVPRVLSAIRMARGVS